MTHDVLVTLLFVDSHSRRIGRLLGRLVLLVTATAGLMWITSTLSGADPSSADWSKLRQCESSGNYGAVSGNGHYGAYQFDISTWRSVGGTGMPNQAGRSEQDYRALYLYRMRGWQPWACAGRVGLHDDPDAGSKRVPTRAQAGYISSGGDTTTAPSVMPKWDGLVYVRGDCSPSLRTFQLRMNVIGSKYHFAGTGCYEQQTLQAVLALQRANGITPSGRLGPQTWRAAWEGKSPF